MGDGSRLTKIQATLGPATTSMETLRRMAEAGMDGCRLNLSHGTHEQARAMIEAVRQLSREMGRPFAIGADLRGPKLRIGDIPGGTISLEEGTSFRLTLGDHPDDTFSVSVGYPHLAEDLHPGSPVLLSDGAIILRVEQVAEDGVLCRVEKGGLLSSRKGVNLPGVPLRVPSLTPRDLEDMAFAVESGVDFLYLSYVRSGGHVEAARGELARLGADLPLVAKVERQEGVDALPEIVRAADGVCVARGDLGIEVPLGAVPAIQSEALALCRAAGKLAMVGGQMLSSMVSSPIPLRSEAADLATTVREGVDAIILSDETAAGSHPVEAVAAADQILRRAEAHLHGRSLEAAVFSQTGWLAESLSASRRFHPILVATKRPQTANWLSAWWGVLPAMCDPANAETTLQRLAEATPGLSGRPRRVLRFSE